MDSQDEVIAFLSRPDSYGDPAGTVERIEPHGSVVFLHGRYAYKLKRAVAYAALDFLTRESRERACRAELVLNRRTAPDLYLAVRSIDRTADGSLIFDGGGSAALDWVVVMRRFPQGALFERMASDGRLTVDLMDKLGEEIARFHALAEITPGFGGADGIRQVIEDNHRELCRYPAVLDVRALYRLHDASLGRLDELASLLDRRRLEGRVRRCHGDMRLANICLLDGRPTLFDGIEFSDPLSCIDVLFDLAFVLMDLDHHSLAPLEDRLLRSYLCHSDALEDCRPLPLFLSLRAATRSFTLACSAGRQEKPTAAHDKARRARALLRLAELFLKETTAQGRRPCVAPPAARSGP
ncbi:phosphotransferase [Pseudomonas indica]|uniref:phosphotransferase n=1 Tax=Pseudomonas indica TaxID=137658 RepID=UPI003FCF1161